MCDASGCVKRKTKRGRGISPPPPSGSVELDEQVVDATGLGGLNERPHHRGIDAFSELEAGLLGPTLDFVREVLRCGVVEVPERSLTVLVIGRAFPDADDTLGHPFRQHLAVSKVQQDALPLGLRHLHLRHAVEGGQGVVEGVDGIVQRRPDELRVQRGRVLLGKVEGIDRNRGTIGADEAEQPHGKGGTQRPVEGVLHLQTEVDIVLADATPDGREVVDGSGTRPAVGDYGVSLPARKTLVAKELFSGAEQALVLEDFVAVCYRGKDLAGVLTAGAEEAGFLAVGREKRDLFDLVVELGGHSLVGFS